MRQAKLPPAELPRRGICRRSGAMTFYQGAHKQVAGLLRQTNDRNRPLPDVAFDRHLTVHTGDDVLNLAT
jgi:hypothetical protein